MEKLAYRVVLKPDDNGTVMVSCPDLPEVATFGDDDDDALLHAVDAIEEALAARIAARDDIPPPVRRRGRLVALPLMTGLKVALYRAAKAAGLRKSDLARRLGVHAPQVDRLFDLDHASQLSQIEAAFRAIGQEIAFEIRDRAA